MSLLLLFKELFEFEFPNKISFEELLFFWSFWRKIGKDNFLNLLRLDFKLIPLLVGDNLKLFASFNSKSFLSDVKSTLSFPFVPVIYLIFVIVYNSANSVALEYSQVIILLLLFFFGVLFTLIGIIGEYLGRIFNQSKNRPIYLVDEYNDEKERNE